MARAAWIIGGLILVVGAWLQWVGLGPTELIPSSKIQHVSGHQFYYQIETRSPVAGLAVTPDANAAWGSSATTVSENDSLLGPSGSPHETIRNAGKGRFSHWGEGLYFSTSDNSDPRANGRTYAVRVALQPGVRPLALIALGILVALMWDLRRAAPKTRNERAFAVVFVLCSPVFLLIPAGFVWAMNPYGNLWLAPAPPVVQITGSQRWTYPALAKSRTFDSAVLGTSTSGSLKPAQLNQLFDAKFVNLAMASATPAEQVALLQVFLRAHPSAEWVIWGLDHVWCQPTAAWRKHEPGFSFPEWMYDNNPINDYTHLLSGTMVRDAMRQFEAARYRLSSEYNDDGYNPFVGPPENYDRQKALGHVYEDHDPSTIIKHEDELDRIGRADATWTFPDIQNLKAAVSAVPQRTRVLLFFVPLHIVRLQVHNTWQEFRACKQRVAAALDQFPNVWLFDLAFPSPFTSTDEHYWDLFHFGRPSAERLGVLLHAAFRGRPDTTEIRVLRSHRPGVMGTVD